MCEKCGHDHPTFAEAVPTALFLENAYTKALEKRIEDIDNPVSINGYVVDNFTNYVITQNLVVMYQEAIQRGLSVEEIMKEFASAMFSLGFSIAMMTSGHFSTDDEVYSEQIAFPTEEEVAVYKERTEAKVLENSPIIDPEAIIAALRESGIELPDNVQVRILNGLQDDQKKGNDDDGHTGLYL